MTAQETKFAPTNDESVFQDLIKYANIVNRYPIYVYEPDMSERLYKDFCSRYFIEEDIYRTQTLKNSNSLSKARVIYFNKYTASWDQPVPLLISGQGMMHGGEKTLLL